MYPDPQKNGERVGQLKGFSIVTVDEERDGDAGSGGALEPTVPSSAVESSEDDSADARGWAASSSVLTSPTAAAANEEEALLRVWR